MAEIVDVVDKEDKVIGQAPRKECHRNKKLIHRAISIFVFDKDGKMLLQKRSMNKDISPGLFSSSCAGHVDVGEGYEETAKREIKEELGIDLKEGELKEVGKMFIEQEEESEFMIQYTLEHDRKMHLNKKEIESGKWASLDEIEKEIEENPEQFAPTFTKLFKGFMETRRK